jgi:hypothetical protein
VPLRTNAMNCVNSCCCRVCVMPGITWVVMVELHPSASKIPAVKTASYRVAVGVQTAGIRW